jgi:hypothetical protein
MLNNMCTMDGKIKTPAVSKVFVKNPVLSS